MLNKDAVLRAPTHAQVRDAAEAQQAVALGATALKLKVGHAALPVELARVAAVRAAVGPAIALRLDANGALADADAWLDAFGPLDVAWWEQPTPPGAPLPRGPAPIAVDEAIRGPADVAAAAASGAAVVVLKPAFLGGLLATWTLAHQAAGLGLRVCVTHAFETAVGRAGAAHLAAALALPGLAGGLLPPGPAPLDARWLTLPTCPATGPAMIMLPDPVVSARLAAADQIAVDAP
ncbi:MAG: hypothetical protein H6706_28255 [Myxococcales bacterium]|nr:hypothetical protein [Myxococcales bacterium]